MSKQSELDEIVREFTRSAYQKPESTFLNAIYYQKFKEELLDWHNEQIEAVLDRLAIEVRASDYIGIAETIQSERNKLKESTDE